MPSEELTDLTPVPPPGAIMPETVPAAPVARSLWYLSWKRLKRNRLAMVGLVIVTALMLTAVGADILSPMDPNRQILEYARKPSGFRGNILLERSAGGGYANDPVTIQSYRLNGTVVEYVDVNGAPGSVPVANLVEGGESEWHQEPLYLLGTDNFGRDVLSRLIHGARISLYIGLSAEILTLLIGVTLGALAGFFRGWVDGVIMYVTNVIWSFPFILLVIAFSLVLGHGTWQAFVAIGIANWVDLCRIVRGQFFALRETEYVEATRAVGFGPIRTIFRHMLPNAAGPITVLATAGFAYAIIAESSLSFLGLGVQAPQASWGQMIRDGYGHIQAGKNWGLTLYPSIAIALAVFGFNMLGDGLRDALDPKLKV